MAGSWGTNAHNAENSLVECSESTPACRCYGEESAHKLLYDSCHYCSRWLVDEWSYLPMPKPFMNVPFTRRIPRFIIGGRLTHSFCAEPSFGGRNGLNKWLEDVSRCIFVLIPAIADNDVDVL